MGDFVNQMVPIPMETVPPRPQRVSPSAGLRGLGTQGSACESARGALQRQRRLFCCLVDTSCCASPGGIQRAGPAPGLQLCLATPFAGQEPRRGRREEAGAGLGSLPQIVFPLLEALSAPAVAPRRSPTRGAQAGARPRFSPALEGVAEG